MEPIEGSLFVPKPYDPFRIGPLLDYIVAARRIGVASTTA